jgi:predicted PurR-regulated permease PerM
MSRKTDLAPNPDSSARQSDTGVQREPAAGGGAAPGDGQAYVRRIPKVGLWAWSFVGFVAATIIVVIALAAVSEIAIPMTFAVVLAVIFKPTVQFLKRHGFKPTLAAGLVVLGLLLVVAAVGVATLRGVTEQADQISAVTDKATSNAADQLDALGISQASLDDARAAVQDAAPTIATGIVTHIVSGIGSLIGLVGGIILGSLIMYYLLKDGSRFRRNLVAEVDDISLRKEIDDFIGDTCEVLRDYGRGRSVMSAVVAVVIGVAALLLGLPLVFTIMVVNFIGGYIPYIGAFLGGGLAVIVALGDGGLPDGVIMLLVVLASNLLLENFVEPKVMGRTLDVHPLIVLIVTALGGMIGGIIGLMLAVPFYVVARDAISRLRSRGFFRVVADRAQPTVQRMLD